MPQTPLLGRPYSLESRHLFKGTQHVKEAIAHGDERLYRLCVADVRKRRGAELVSSRTYAKAIQFAAAVYSGQNADCLRLSPIRCAQIHRGISDMVLGTNFASCHASQQVKLPVSPSSWIPSRCCYPPSMPPEKQHLGNALLPA